MRLDKTGYTAGETIFWKGRDIENSAKNHMAEDMAGKILDEVFSGREFTSKDLKSILEATEASKFAELADNKEFLDFVNIIAKDYPDFTEEIMPWHIPFIAKNFDSFSKDYVDYYNFCRDNFPNLAFPDFQFMYAKNKHRILELLFEKKMSKIIPTLYKEGAVWYWNLYGDDFTKASDLIEDGSGEHLYSSLVMKWGVLPIHLDKFLSILVDKEKREFFGNGNNALKYNEIIETYGAGEKIGKNEYVMGVDFNPNIFYIMGVVDNYDFLMDKGVNDRVMQYFPDKYVQTKEGEVVLPIDFLEDLGAKNYQYPGFFDENFEDYAEIFREKYGMSDPEIVKAIGKSDISDMNSHLGDGDVVEAFEWMNGLGDFDSTFDAIVAASVVSRFSRAEEVFKVLKESGGFKIDRVFVGFLEKQILRNEEITEQILKPDVARVLSVLSLSKKNIDIIDLLDLSKSIFSDNGLMKKILQPGFGDFYKYVIDSYSFRGIGLNVIVNGITILFDEYLLKSGDKELDLFFTPEYQDALDFVFKEFREFKNCFPFYAFKIVEFGSIDEVKSVINKLKEAGETIRSTDIPFIISICKNKDFKELVFKKKDMISEVKPLYSKEKYIAKWVWHTAPPMKYRKNYTERPPLEALSNLALLRLCLLKRAFEDESFLAEVGGLAYTDMADLSTEYGGVIGEENGKLVLRPLLPELKSGDGSYWQVFSNLYFDNILSFHLHVQKEGNPYATSPSGWIGAKKNGSGDINFVMRNNGVGCLISAVKRHETDPTKLYVNVDMYFVDESGDEPILYVIDMGLFVVPV